MLAIHLKMVICKLSSSEGPWELLMGQHHCGHRPGRPPGWFSVHSVGVQPLFDVPAHFGSLLSSVFPEVCLCHHLCIVGISI